MYIKSWGLNLLAIAADGKKLLQVSALTPPPGFQLVEIDAVMARDLENAQPKGNEVGVPVASGPLAGYRFIKSHVPGSFNLFKGHFVCAEPVVATKGAPVSVDRDRAGVWESFSFITPEAAARCLEREYHTGEALRSRVQAMTSQGQPVCLHFGCASNLLKGFLNIDGFAFFGPFGEIEDYFILNFTEERWPIPNSSVDYIYSEDFIEHIPQKNQVAFLAECFRVLKPGGYNRISTPCLASSMKFNSNFNEGIDGVYFAEFDKWGHIALFTKGFIEDLSNAIGYRQAIFTEKSAASSPYAVLDRRPGADRTWQGANIFVDLLK